MASFLHKLLLTALVCLLVDRHVLQSLAVPSSPPPPPETSTTEEKEKEPAIIVPPPRVHRVDGFLSPQFPSLSHQSILPNGIDRRQYFLKNLEPHTKYEVRVSYLGSPPARFEVSLMYLGRDDQVEWHGAQQPSTQRRLLDTARVYFYTESAGEVRLPLDSPQHEAREDDDKMGEQTNAQYSGGRVIAVLRAVTWGRSVSAAAEGHHHHGPTEFHVMLEAIDYGVLPRSVLPLVAVLLFFGLFSLFVIVPWLTKRLVAKVDAPSSVAAAIPASHHNNRPVAAANAPSERTAERGGKKKSVATPKPHTSQLSKR